MRVLDRLATWLQTKAQKDRQKYLHSTIRQWEGAGHLGAKRRPLNQASMLARFQGWVYACATLNAKACASVPLRLYASKTGGGKGATRAVGRKRLEYLRGGMEQRPGKSAMMRARSTDDVEEVTDHPILDLLHNVNPWLDGYNFTMLRFLYLQITGNAYYHPIIGEAGVPSELWLMPSHHVEIIPDRDTNFIDGFVYGRPPNEDVYPADEVLFEKIADPMDVHYGRGWVPAAVSAIDLLSSMDDYELALFDNMARPDWGVFVAQALTDAQFNRINAQIESRLRGRKKSGRPYIFEGGADAKPLQFSPRDLAFSDGEERKIEAVAAVAGVPVSKLKANDPNRAGAALGDYGWMKDTIAPYLTLDEEFLNQSLVPLFGDFGESLFLAYDNPVPQDAAQVSAVDVAETGAAIKTVNEARADRGLEPIEGGDVPRYQGVPLDKVGVTGPPQPPGVVGAAPDDEPPPGGSMEDGEKGTKAINEAPPEDDAILVPVDAARSAGYMLARYQPIGQKAPDVNVTMPEIKVHVPEVRSPDVVVKAADVVVNVPDIKAPDVVVNMPVPEQVDVLVDGQPVRDVEIIRGSDGRIAGARVSDAR
jgi:HK97 family phage portal protein